LVAGHGADGLSDVISNHSDKTGRIVSHERLGVVGKEKLNAIVVFSHHHCSERAKEKAVVHGREV
jgi:hypothetical protein